MNNVEYISETLCHFVGRSLPNDDARYNLLLKIIKEDKALYANGEKQLSEAILEPDGPEKELGNLFNKCSCVCFCDIPDEALGIHREKYGFLGLGFQKSFLISKGTRPVMYIPQNFEMSYSKDNLKKVDPFYYYINLLYHIYALARWIEIPDMDSSEYDQLILTIAANPKLEETFTPFKETPYAKDLYVKGMKELLERIERVWWTQCAYVKIFDSTLEKDNEKNYYMEREWRCLFRVPFLINDIDKIYVPNETYAQRIRNDIPEFAGKIVGREGKILDL